MTKPSCIHHWLIDTPDGPTTHAQCKLCGAKKEFVSGLPSKKKANWGHGEPVVRLKGSRPVGDWGKAYTDAE